MQTSIVKNISFTCKLASTKSKVTGFYRIRQTKSHAERRPTLQCFQSQQCRSFISSLPQTNRLTSRLQFRPRASAESEEESEKEVSMEEMNDVVQETAAVKKEEASIHTYENDPDEVVYDSMGVSDLKAVLLDSFYGTERGLTASSEVRAEINELLTQLEALNPTASPTEELQMLSGIWKLAYTSNSELSFLLAASNLPLLTIGDITQIIKGDQGLVENQVEVSTPVARRLISAVASFEARSPKRLEVQFTNTKIGSPELLDETEFPSDLNIGGKSFDISPLQGIAGQLKELLRPLATLVTNQPDLNINLPDQAGAKSWLLTTYLDEDIRIARGDGGSIFVLTKVVEV